MGMTTGGGGGVRSDINVTPLVDVCLVLLIIFMVITPMLQKGQHVELPKAKHLATRKTPPGQKPVEPIVLAVKKDGTYWIDKDELSVDQLAARVDVAHRTNPNRPIMVKGDKRVEYGKVRALLKALEDDGIQGASLAAAKIKGAKGKGGDSEGNGD